MNDELKFISGLLIGYVACKTICKCKEDKKKKEEAQKKCKCVCKNCYYKRYEKKERC